MKKFITNHKKDLLIYFGYILILLLFITLATAFKSAPYNSLAVDLGFIQIAWYAVFILFGIIAGAVMAFNEFKRLGWDTEILMDGLLIIAPLAIVGARLYYVLFDPAGSPETFIDVIAIWDGGLAIHGAIIVATIGVIILSRVKKINVWTLADILAIGLLMGQVAGRWGNFMNAEAHGGVTTSANLINFLPNFISNQMSYSGSRLLMDGIYHPTFLYESSLNFIALTTLLIFRRNRLLKNGESLGLYLIWYGLVRGLIIEPMRTDQLKEILGVPVNILLSLLLLTGTGIAIIIYKRFIKKDDPFYKDLLINDLNVEDEVNA